MPYHWSLYLRRSKGTLSKAFEKSRNIESICCLSSRTKTSLFRKEHFCEKIDKFIDLLKCLLNFENAHIKTCFKLGSVSS